MIHVYYYLKSQCETKCFCGAVKMLNKLLANLKYFMHSFFSAFLFWWLLG